MESNGSNSLDEIYIYTDGACKGNPGKGGWGVYFEIDGQSTELFGSENPTTNNRMELTSAVEALSALPFSMKVTLYSDSQYVIKGMSEWITNWKKKNWKDVKNVDLWKKLDDVSQKHSITWRWVKGHNGNLGNERADALANKGIYSQY